MEEESELEQIVNRESTSDEKEDEKEEEEKLKKDYQWFTVKTPEEEEKKEDKLFSRDNTIGFYKKSAYSGLYKVRL